MEDLRTNRGQGNGSKGSQDKLGWICSWKGDGERTWGRLPTILTTFVHYHVNASSPHPPDMQLQGTNGTWRRHHEQPGPLKLGSRKGYLQGFMGRELATGWFARNQSEFVS